MDGRIVGFEAEIAESVQDRAGAFGQQDAIAVGEAAKRVALVGWSYGAIVAP